ncbi:MAG: hypothetical protein LBT97_04640 [Planctomycetota bacterium]|jgi:hypothetical protein|nr:hypothetical protein [Planctomycetota bacterium]
MGLFLFRPGFLLLCLYAMVYVMLRTNGEIVSRNPSAYQGGTAYTEYVVCPDPALPRYRRQFYRAVFSPFMVAEEEGRWLGSRGRGLIERVGEYGRRLLPD